MTNNHQNTVECRDSYDWPQIDCPWRTSLSDWLRPSSASGRRLGATVAIVLSLLSQPQSAHASGTQLPYELVDDVGLEGRDQDASVMDLVMRFEPAAVADVDLTITLRTDKGEAIAITEDRVVPLKEQTQISGTIELTLSPGLYVQHIRGNVYLREGDFPLGLDLYRYLEVGDGVRVLSADEYSDLAMPTTRFVDQYGRSRAVQFVDLPPEKAATEDVVKYTAAVPDADGATHDSLLGAKAKTGGTR